MAKNAKMIKSPDGNKLAIVNCQTLLVLILLTQKCRYAFRKIEMEIIIVGSVASPVNSIGLSHG
ncbi:hypothetical protein [uncultured Parabacteroides sp.]|uniref:hypothetical protein n=1 Tax=uncultured Parabacteroides sp. TaxID=512312 RepID=UPI00261704A9|nr:hypothetical protein [uncultured Parabacteroides sp.]